jgi:hypothetical protein
VYLLSNSEKNKSVSDAVSKPNKIPNHMKETEKKEKHFF